MNWDEISAIADFLSAIAVVVSLLYLGRQIQVSVRQQRMEGHRAVSEEFNRINEMWVDLEQTGMMIRAWDNWEAATAQEQHIAAVLLIKAMNHLQTMYFMRQAHGIDESLYLAEEDFTCLLLATSGGKAWWSGFQGGFVEGLRNRINDRLATEKFPPIKEAVPFWDAEKWK